MTDLTPIERAEKALSDLWDDASEYGSQEDMARTVFASIDTEAIARLLQNHQLTTGMQVASGHTCKCGYWNGQERPGQNRPVGLYGLTWHQANIIHNHLTQETP